MNSKDPILHFLEQNGHSCESQRKKKEEEQDIIMPRPTLQESKDGRGTSSPP